MVDFLLLILLSCLDNLKCNVVVVVINQRSLDPGGNKRVDACMLPLDQESVSWTD